MFDNHKVVFKLLIISFFLNIQTSFAQEQTMPTIRSLTNLMQAHELVSDKSNNTDSSIKGSPYYHPDFIKSNLYFKNDLVFKDVLVRLNIYKSSFEYLQDKSVLSIENLDKLVSINMNGDIFLPINGEFYKVESDKDIQILSRSTAVFREKKEPQNGYETSKPAQFVRNDEGYFLKLESGNLISCKNKSSFLKEISNEFPQVASFIKKNKLKSNKMADLKKISTFMSETL